MGFQALYLIYLVSALCFVLALRLFSKPQTAVIGNRFAILGMGLCVFTSLLALPMKNDLGMLIAGGLSAVIGISWALKIQMTKLPQTPYETAESLEQLRALQNGMKIRVAVVENVPVGIDTIEDFEKFKKMVEG